MPGYDLVVVGSGFAGSTAALSFLEATEKAGQVGRVALIEALPAARPRQQAHARPGGAE